MPAATSDSPTPLPVAATAVAEGVQWAAENIEVLDKWRKAPPEIEAVADVWSRARDIRKHLSGSGPAGVLDQLTVNMEFPELDELADVWEEGREERLKEG